MQAEGSVEDGAEHKDPIMNLIEDEEFARFVEEKEAEERQHRMAVLHERTSEEVKEEASVEGGSEVSGGSCRVLLLVTSTALHHFTGLSSPLGPFACFTDTFILICTLGFHSCSSLPLIYFSLKNIFCNHTLSHLLHPPILATNPTSTPLSISL